MRLRTRSLTIMISRGLTQASSLVLAICLVRLVDKETYGTFRQGLLLLTVFSGTLLANISDGLFYFLPKLGPSNRRKLLWQTMGFSLTVAAVAAGVLVAAAPHVARLFGDNPRLGGVVRILAFHLFADALLVMIGSYMISLDRAVQAGLYSVVGAAVRVLTVIFAFIGGLGLNGAFILMVVTDSAVALIGMLHMFRLAPPTPWEFDWGLLREQIGYTWPLWLRSGVALLNSRLDQFLISSFFSTSSYAVYVNGATGLPILGLITASIGTALMPNLVSLMRDGRTDQALGLWQNGARKASLVILPCFVFFLLTAQDLMVFLYGRQYAMAAWPFTIYLFLLPIRVAVYAAMFRALGKTRPLAVGVTLAFAVNVPVSTLATYLGRGTLLGFIAPCLGNVLSNMCTVVYMLIMLGRFTGRSPLAVLPLRDMGRTMIWSFVAGVPIFVLGRVEMPLIVRLITQAGLFAVLYLALMLATKSLREDEIQMLRAPLGLLRGLLKRL